MEMGADQLNYIVTKPKTPEPHNPPSFVPPPPPPPPPPSDKNTVSIADDLCD